ncbi:MAG: hypothetical protein V1696_03815 [Candidatus Jorgensenbacteria bacterium]
MAKIVLKLDEEPKGSPEIDGVKSAKTPYAGIKDEITEEDLENNKVAKVVARTLLGDTKRYQSEIAGLKPFKDKFYQKSEESAVLKERLLGLGESIGVRNLLFTVGGLLGGLFFTPDLLQYRWGIALLCLASFVLAMWNPDFLKSFKKNNS